MRCALLVVWALAACGSSDDRLTSTKLAGFEIALPDWPHVALGRDWSSDVVRVSDPERRRLVTVSWSPSDAALEGDALAAVLDSVERTGKAKLAAPTPTRIGGHDGHMAPLEGALEGIIGTWYCPEHGRAYVIGVVAAAEVRTAILESIRCHTEPAPTHGVAVVFPRYEPPSGMAREPDDDPLSQTWTDGTSVVLLNVGSVNREVRRGDVDMKAERLLRVAIESGVGTGTPITMSRAVGSDGLTRYLGAITVAEDEGKSEGLMALWVCPGSDLVFVAGHLANEHAVGPAAAREHLLRATCP